MVIGWNGDGIMDGWNHTATPTTITIVSIGGSSINLGWGEAPSRHPAHLPTTTWPPTCPAAIVGGGGMGIEWSGDMGGVKCSERRGWAGGRAPLDHWGSARVRTSGRPLRVLEGITPPRQQWVVRSAQMLRLRQKMRPWPHYALSQEMCTEGCPRPSPLPKGMIVSSSKMYRGENLRRLLQDLPTPLDRQMRAHLRKYGIIVHCPKVRYSE